MAKKNARNTRGKIVEAAWRLFYEQGYENTTVEEIIESSHTSKGSFYHYFDGKDALLSTLSDLFDQKYLDLQKTMDPDLDAMEKLLLLNRELFWMIENSVSMELLARLLSTQLVTNGEKQLLDHKLDLCPPFSWRISSPRARRPASSPKTAASNRHGKGLCLCDAGADVRLVPVRGGVLSAGLRRPADAYFFIRFSSRHSSKVRSEENP